MTKGDTNVIVQESEYTTTLYAESTIHNEGDAVAKVAEITVDWYDDAGEYLASTTGYLHGVEPGERWVPRINGTYDVENPSTVAAAETNIASVSKATSWNPDGLVVESELRASNNSVIVRGTVTNNRENTVDYLEVIPKVHNNQDRVLASRWTNHTNLSSNSQFRFELRLLTGGRGDQVTGHEVEISLNAF